MAQLTEIAAWLDEELDCREWPDSTGAQNGLQVEAGSGRVERVGVAVDASLLTVRDAITADVDLLIVHHGLLWGGGRRFVDVYGETLRLLFTHGISLYSAHLPLDAHPRYGNNAVLADKLGLRDIEPFGTYLGREIGVKGVSDQSAEDLAHRLAHLCQGGGLRGTPVPEPGRPVGAVAVVSGGAGEFWQAALAAGCRLLITGETRHHEMVAAADHGFGLWAAGHYETEVFGVRAIGEEIARRFAVETVPVGRPASTDMI